MRATSPSDLLNYTRTVAACLVCLAMALVTGCHGWSYATSSSFGPTYWPQYFPECNATTLVQSPVAFTTADGSGSSVSYRMSFHRLVDSTVPEGGVSFVTMLNAGGLLEATPTSAFPMRVLQFSNAGALLSSATKYLVKIAFHYGIEHTGAVANAASPTIELQYVFADAPAGVPTVVFCQQARAVDTTTADDSVAYLVLSRVPAYASATARGGSTTNVADAYAPLFLNGSSTTSTRAIVYEGRTTYPPCSAVTTIVSTDLFYIPRTVSRGMLLAGNSIRTVRPEQNRSAVAVLDYALVAQGNPVNLGNVLLNTPAPTRYVDVYTPRIVPNAKNEYMMDAIIALVATNGCLLLAIAVLLMARWECIDWPMWLGGLRRPVEWWTNPRSAGAEEAYEEDEEDEEGEEDEEEDEEVPEGERGATVVVGAA